MFNTFQFNTKVFGGLGVVVPEVTSDSIIFNGYSLQNTSIVTQKLIQDNTPERDFETSPVPRGDGSIITGDFWRDKKILISGIIKKSTNIELEAEIDAMKKALAVGEGILDITIGGVVRRYVATLVNGEDMFSQRMGYHISFCPFEVQFESVEPFGKSVNYAALGFLANTALVFNEQADNNGTTRAKPVVILNFTAANSVTAVSFKNNTTGEEIKITTPISAGDYLKFDSEEMEVTLNAVIKDYQGSFPVLNTGGNSFTITITGISATYDLTVKHKTPYL